MKFYIYIIIFLLVSCNQPNDPVTSEDIVSFSMYIDTYGEALDVDITETSMVVAANYQGFIVYDIIRNETGNITSVDSVFNDSDMDGTMGDNRAQEVIISQNHDIAFITDIYDRIWLYKLNEGSQQYVDNYLQDCYGGTWLNLAIDDQSDHIKAFSLIKHSSSESDDDGTIGEFDEYSTSIVWKGLYDIDDSDIFPEDNAAPSCEFSYNFGVLPEKISFNNGILAVSNGELGVQILKQLDESSCFDSETYELLTDFVPTGDIDFDRTICQQAFDEYYNPGLNGVYEPAGGFYPYIYNSFDLPGEVNSIMFRNSVVFTGLSTSNGCYMSLLDSNGSVIDNLSIANGYTINGLDEDGGVIALSAGHDGVLLYRHWGEFDEGLIGPVTFIGQINTPYSNNVKLDGDNLIISTEDGIYLYILK